MLSVYPSEKQAAVKPEVCEAVQTTCGAEEKTTTQPFETTQITAEINSDTNVYYESKTQTFYEPEQESIVVVDEGSTAYADDSIAVFFTEDADDEDKQRAVDFLEGEIVGKIEDMNEYEIKFRHSELEEITAKCDELMKDEKVEFASLSVFSATEDEYVPNDPWNGYPKWNDDATATTSYAFNNWWIKATEIDKAWDYKDKFSHINIGIVDSGFDVEHEDLKGKFMFPDEFFEKNNNISHHGTHVAGIIGAVHDNNVGISGVVDDCTMICADWNADKEQGQKWNNEARIMTGFINVVKAGAKVVNFSFGSSGTIPAGTDRWKIVKDAEAKYTSYFMAKLLQRGYDFVCCQSAGNGVKKDKGLKSYAVDASNNGNFCTITEKNAIRTVKGVTPKDITDRIIIVASAKFNGYDSYEQSSFSNGGNQVSICAPGSYIYSTYRSEDETVSDKYAYLSGTSMACPIVTGIASLVWSVNQSFTGAQVKHFVCDEENTKFDVADCTDETHLPTGKMRMVNAKLAVEAAIRATQTNGTVNGHVRWARNTADKFVTLMITDKTTGTNYNIHTDKDGRFSASLPAGEYVLTVTGSPKYAREFTVLAPVIAEETEEQTEILPEVQTTELGEILLSYSSLDCESYKYKQLNAAKRILSAIGLY